MWIKKESLYHKPFYKQKLKLSLCIVMLMGIVFFAYQIFYMNQLQFTLSPSNLKHTMSMQTNVNLLSTAISHHQIEESSRKKIIRYADESTAKIDLFYPFPFDRGIRLRDYDLYNPSIMAIFQCIKSQVLIPIDKVNDDYCDCPEDGSDEPETNACTNGRFYCTYQKRYFLNKLNLQSQGKPFGRCTGQSE